MKVTVIPHFIVPTLEYANRSHKAAQVAPIEKKLPEAVPGPTHQKVREKLTVVAPKDVKPMIDGEYHMKVRAIERLRSSSFQPYLRIRGPTHGAASVLAGVEDDRFIIVIGTCVDMVALCRSLAGHDGYGRVLLTRVQNMATFIIMVVVKKYLLDDPRLHSIHPPDFTSLLFFYDRIIQMLSPLPKYFSSRSRNVSSVRPTTCSLAARAIRNPKLVRPPRPGSLMQQEVKDLVKYL
jgi:hypothetical protein